MAVENILGSEKLEKDILRLPGEDEKEQFPPVAGCTGEEGARPRRAIPRVGRLHAGRWGPAHARHPRATPAAGCRVSRGNRVRTEIPDSRHADRAKRAGLARPDDLDERRGDKSDKVC